MFAFLFNAVFAFVYTYAAFSHPDEAMPFTTWGGGFHAGLALAVALMFLANRKRGEG